MELPGTRPDAPLGEEDLVVPLPPGEKHCLEPDDWTHDPRDHLELAPTEGGPRPPAGFLNLLGGRAARIRVE